MKRMTRVLVFAVGLVGLSACVVVEDTSTPIYDPCFNTRECDAFSDACYEVTIDYGDAVVTDAMCSVGCLDDFDCPYDGICLSLEGEPAICYQPCFDDFDCAGGFACIDAVGPRTIDAVCLPF